MKTIFYIISILLISQGLLAAEDSHYDCEGNLERMQRTLALENKALDNIHDKSDEYTNREDALKTFMSVISKEIELSEVSDGDLRTKMKAFDEFNCPEGEGKDWKEKCWALFINNKNTIENNQQSRKKVINDLLETPVGKSFKEIKVQLAKRFVKNKCDTYSDNYGQIEWYKKYFEVHCSQSVNASMGIKSFVQDMMNATSETLRNNISVDETKEKAACFDLNELNVAVYNEEVCVNPCPVPGQIFNSTKARCETRCHPDAKQLDDGTCQCRAGFNDMFDTVDKADRPLLKGIQCKNSCPTGGAFNQITKECSCPSGQEDNGSGVCTNLCKNGQSPSDDCIAVCDPYEVRKPGGSCGCVEGFEKVNLKCVPKCFGGQVRKGGRLNPYCVCPQNKKFDSKKKKCVFDVKRYEKAKREKRRDQKFWKAAKITGGVVLGGLTLYGTAKWIGSSFDDGETEKVYHYNTSNTSTSNNWSVPSYYAPSYQQLYYQQDYQYSVPNYTNYWGY